MKYKEILRAEGGQDDQPSIYGRLVPNFNSPYNSRIGSLPHPETTAKLEQIASESLARSVLRIPEIKDC